MLVGIVCIVYCSIAIIHYEVSGLMQSGNDREKLYLWSALALAEQSPSKALTKPNKIHASVVPGCTEIWFHSDPWSRGDRGLASSVHKKTLKDLRVGKSVCIHPQPGTEISQFCCFTFSEFHLHF